MSEQYEQKAYELGEQHAANAASWVTDGNDTDESRRRKLQMLRDGDPQAFDVLPAMPNLSGEWADDLTPEKLFDEIVGDDFPVRSDHPDADSLLDAICDAYEAGVSETFESACETELMRWFD